MACAAGPTLVSPAADPGTLVIVSRRRSRSGDGTMPCDGRASRRVAWITSWSMAKKILLDVDPGIDDAVALCLALFDPQLEVVAVTAVGGNVRPEQATRNVQAIIEQLDPPRWPRIGAGHHARAGPAQSRRATARGRWTGQRQVSRSPSCSTRHPSEKVICDEIRAAAGELTIVALGPADQPGSGLCPRPRPGRTWSARS